MKRIDRIFLYACLIITNTFLVTTVNAATFDVNTTEDTIDTNVWDTTCADVSGNCSLRAAMMQAITLTEDSIINLPGGTYNLTVPAADPDYGDASVGDLDLSTNEVTINGDGADTTIINGGGYEVVFDLYYSGGTLRLNDLTVSNADAAAFINTGTLTAANCVFSDLNYAAFFSSNNSRISLATSILTQIGDGNYQGIAISQDSVLVLYETSMHAINSYDAAVYVATGGTATIINSAIYNNSSRALNVEGSAFVGNSTFTGNTATGNGGGINVVSGGSVQLFSSTIAGNTADSDGDGSGVGGGFYVASGGTLAMRNTLVATNGSGVAGGPDCSVAGTFTSNDYNFIEDLAECGVSVAAHDLTGLDPRLSTLADNGGPTPTMALLVGSPAIDGGNPANCVFRSTTLPVDQRGTGFDRHIDGNKDGIATCDIGAYEHAELPDTESSCADTLDDDLDGLTDCSDDDCASATECQPVPTDTDSDTGTDTTASTGTESDTDTSTESETETETMTDSSTDSGENNSDDETSTDTESGGGSDSDTTNDDADPAESIITPTSSGCALITAQHPSESGNNHFPIVLFILGIFTVMTLGRRSSTC